MRYKSYTNQFAITFIILLTLCLLLSCMFFKNPTVNEIHSFRENGYLVIPNVLTDNEVNEFNKLIHNEVEKVDAKRNMDTFN